MHIVEILCVFNMEKGDAATVLLLVYALEKLKSKKRIGRSGSNHTWPSFLELKKIKKVFLCSNF